MADEKEIENEGKNAVDTEKREYKSDDEILEELKDLIFREIRNRKVKLKVGDLLKVIEIQKKLSSDTKAEEKFWEIIEQIRQEELKDEE